MRYGPVFQRQLSGLYDTAKAMSLIGMKLLKRANLRTTGLGLHGLLSHHSR